MEITKMQDGTMLTVTVSGRITTNTAPELDEALSDLSDIKNLILDLAGVEFCSSAGLRVFLSAQKTMTANGGEMKLVNVCSDVMDVFNITGFSGILIID